MFNFSKKKEEPKNIEEILAQFKKLKGENESLKKEIEKIKEESFSFLKKMEMVRYNPFSELGGNQSFSIALLNKKNDGILITGLYTENGSRVYAKSIEKGVSKYSLSKEESSLIKRIVENQ